ncbi:unannotated protein [freshwater metagenome]|uniref:Unannotated protein n=1 Tax=freshwater metagenome TaxID=449393 RepID=A0A6J6YUQ3_9ZZZZ
MISQFSAFSHEIPNGSAIEIAKDAIEALRVALVRTNHELNKTKLVSGNNINIPPPPQATPLPPLNFRVTGYE